ncbi:apolipoprotein D-like [Narcine bancroftii]|uniref:apolipoprotein D-like n=1 Tax=Narcine bancroftii TaxID=1343680 RepID=UPI0038320AE0
MQRALLMLVVSAFCFTGVKSSKHRCSEIQVQANFSLKQFMGKWYEIESLPSPFVSGKCIVQTFIPKDNGWVDLNTDMILKNGSLLQSVGILVPANLNITATLQYRSGLPLQHFPTFGELSFVPYQILSTDYTSYSLVYSCFQRSIISQGYAEHASILSRQRNLPENITQHLYETMNIFKIPTEKLIKINQEGCS